MKKNQQPDAKKKETSSQKIEKNSGSGQFNQGAEQEPDMNDGVADGTPDPDKVSKEKENPKSHIPNNDADNS